jgi:hypothetical protein
MLLLATLHHDPDHCWARPENEEKAMEFINSMADRAGSLDIKLEGAYVSPNEHTFYFLLETDEFAAVTAFLGPPALTDHEAHVTPIMSMQKAAETLLE